MNKLHEEFVRCGRAAIEWRRKCELLLPEIYKSGVWRRKGFGSIYEYAAKLAGMSANTVDECLRVFRRIEDKPELMKVAAEKGLQAVRPVAAIATQETAAFWAEKVKDMSRHTLETYVKDIRLENHRVEEIQPVKLTLELDPKIAAELEKLKGNGSWNELMTKLLRQEIPEPVRATSRHIPNHIQYFVKEKYAGRCHYPSCQRQGEILHHTQRFALEKVHDPSRLVYLCKEHERIAHLGLFDNEEESTFAWN
jgi:hypothetical protein